MLYRDKNQQQKYRRVLERLFFFQLQPIWIFVSASFVLFNSIIKNDWIKNIKNGEPLTYDADLVHPEDEETGRLQPSIDSDRISNTGGIH